MGNIYSFSSRTKLDAQRVREAVEQINQDRFNGYFKVVGAEFPYDKFAVEISHPNKEGGFSFWYQSQKKWGGKYPQSEGDVGTWYAGIFYEELAYRFQGKLSYEGQKGTQTPDPKGAPWCKSFEEFLEQKMSLTIPQNVRESFVQTFLKFADFPLPLLETHFRKPKEPSE